MAINLTKGQRVQIGLQKAHVGLGWDVDDTSGKGFDLDLFAFMLGENKKIPEDEYLVFFNNLVSKDGAVTSSGDDRTGENSEGDDESLTIDFSKINFSICEIIIGATIHEAEEKKQNFGQVQNSFIRICNAVSMEELCKYELTEDFSIETGVEFGRFYKKDGGWRFEAVGRGYKGGLEFFAGKYA